MEVTETVVLTTRKAWRAWLKKHHAAKKEIWFTYFKKGSGKPSVPYAEAVEEALCFGWIDTTVKTLDTERYVQRFTPRKKGSNWSGPNLERVRRLIANGLMTPAGAVHLPDAKQAKSFQEKHDWRTTAPTAAPKDLAAELKKNPRAAAFWKSLAPSYRRLYGRMIREAKKPETRASRVVQLMKRLEQGVKHPLDKVAP
jgi:uncharacterized protein YdeI (YjbR/CyaY-like superfamily)